ncbi:hypothetical protein BR93DRAFT_266929 [Coniochaeta sp. PMI_546]|nr:hypothetical protein BR93DRAFT_266929 [Coniochaeta sp. PMI_546]
MEVQAHLILSDLVYNMEGCSTRFRYLHNRALTVSREISLHLIDASLADRNTADNDPITEVRRRVWWHIVSTDWLLSIMGGPQDRTYQVHPRHMIVNFPRNVNDEEMSADLPADTGTDMTYFLLRVRLAEVCRKVVDFLPPGSCDIDGLPYDQVLAISQLFDGARATMPSSFTLDAPIKPDTRPSAAIDRRIIHLAFHARLARVFRPFLLVPDQTRPSKNFDPRCLHFRAMCLHSARFVLIIASTLLRESLEKSAGRLLPFPLIHRSGCVISHMFMACVVLATDPTLASSNGDGLLSSDVDTIRLELENARRLLETVGEKSPMAASLVQTLIGVLKKHNVHATTPTKEGKPEVQYGSKGPVVNALSDLVTAHAVLSESSNTNPYPDHTAASIGKGLAEQQRSSQFYTNPQHVDNSTQGIIDAGWVVNGDTVYNTQSIDGMGWLDFTNAGYTEVDSWGELFADLDAAFPASM